MKAVGLLEYLPINHPNSLLDVELPVPTPQGRELLVQVQAVSLNPVDTKVRSPKAALETSPKVLGWDAAGTVVAVGLDCTLFKVGDAVYYAGDIRKAGSNSEFQVIDERIVGHKPRNLSFLEAAALPLTVLTAWEVLFERMGISQMGLDAGKSILIIGGAGGVGSVAIQLAKHAGLTVIATASRAETRDWCSKMGADHIIDHRQNLLEQLKTLGLAGVPYILCTNDTVGHWAGMMESILAQGVICSIVGTSQPLNIQPLMNKSATFVWELMFTKSSYQTEDMQSQHDILNRFAQLLEAGTLQGTLTRSLSPINAQNLKIAHATLERGTMIGKFALEGWEQ